MKAADVARVRMRRSGLLGPLVDKPVEVVRSHLAMQSQDFGPAKWSIAQRLPAAEDGVIQRAFDNGAFLRTHVMRETWHFVARADLRWLMELTGPRVQKGAQSRYETLGLDHKTRDRAAKIISKSLADENHLTRREIGEVLRRSRIDVEGQRLPYILSHCELESIVCSGRVNGKQQTYALFDERVPQARFDRDEAVTELVRRYLSSHGPATLKDMSWWSGLTMADLRAGLESIGAPSEVVDGLTLWSLGDPPRGGARKPAIHLLQAYDELIVGYTESRHLGDPSREAAKRAFSSRNLPTGTVLFGTRIVGHWRRSTKGDRIDVEALFYAKPGRDEAKTLRDAVDELGRFTDKETSLTIGAL